MKTIFFALCCALAVISCSDEGKIAVAFQGDEELGEGRQVPILLGQNFPNPFDRITTIRFTVATQTHISLKVLTEDWQEVAVLEDRVILPGFYNAIFAAGNLPSGDYYYVLEGSGNTQVRKMRVAK